MELELHYPFTSADGKRIAKLEMRRPKVKDMKAAARFGDKPEDQEIGLFGILCGLTAEDIQDMDLADYGRLQDSFRAMLDKSKKLMADDGATGEVVPVPGQ